MAFCVWLFAAAISVAPRTWLHGSKKSMKYGIVISYLDLPPNFMSLPLPALLPHLPAFFLGPILIPTNALVFNGGTSLFVMWHKCSVSKAQTHVNASNDDSVMLGFGVMDAGWFF